MKKLLLPFLLLAATLATSQPSIQWQKTYGGSFADNEINAESLTADGGYILAGVFNFGDALLVKLDASGNTVWKKTYGGSNDDKFYSVQQTSDGGYIAAGSTGSNDGDVSGLHNPVNFLTDIWVVKFNSDGIITWQKCLGGTLSEGAASIKQTADGGYIIAGTSQSNDGDITGNHGSNDCVVIKLNSSGTIVWEKTLGGTQVDNATSIQQTNEGGYIVAVASASNDGDVSGHHGAINYGNSDYWIVKLDATGAITWQKSLGGTTDDYPATLQQTADNGYIISGKSRSVDGDVTGNHGSYDYWVVKTDAGGTILWQKSLGGTDEDDGFAIQQTSDGGYIVCGQTVSNDGDVSGHNIPIFYPDAWVVKLTGAGAITWQKCLGGGTADYGVDIKEIAGGFAMVGYYYSRGYYSAGDYWLAKLDASGNLSLQATAGASGGDDFCYSSQQTSDGGYIMVGDVASTNGDVTNVHGRYDWWVVKTNSTGAIQWKKSLGGSGNDYANTIRQTSDGGYIISGETSSTDGDVTGNHGINDCWVVKLDPSGIITWQKSLGGTGSDFAEDIIQTSDGGYMMVGNTTSNDGDVSGNHGGLDYWVVKLTSSGNISWQKCLGGSMYDYAYSIKQTSDGGYIVAGDVSSNDGDVSGNHGSFDYWIVKLDGTGKITWKKTMGGAGEDDAHDIQPTSDGGYIVAGFSNSIDGYVSGNHGGFDYWIVKINALGGIIWQKSLGGTQTDYAYSIKQTSDGGYAVGGYEYSKDGDVTDNHGNYDYWVVKLNNLGALIWQKTLGGTNNDYAYSLQLTSDGGFLISGDSQSNDGDVTNNHQATGFRGLWDYWAVKLSPAGGVPLSLLSFNALQMKNDVLTQWQTTNEVNVSHFELQRSADGINYSTIANINATNSTSENNYQFIDVGVVLNNAGKKLFYRLKMVDIDGRFTYSNISVIIIHANNAISIYPNPAKDYIRIEGVKEGMTIEINDASGKLVKRFIANASKRYLVTGLQKGLYFVKIPEKENTTVTKLIIE